jgi:hypothetical protein
MSNDGEEDGDDFMEKLQQRELDELVLAEAFSNSYKLLTKEMTFDEMLDKESNDEYVAVLAYDPDHGPLLIELESMIDYYIEFEEYEMCAKIKDIMNEKYPQSIIEE